MPPFIAHYREGVMAPKVQLWFERGVEEQELVVSERYNPGEAIACTQAGIRGGLPRGKTDAVDAG